MTLPIAPLVLTAFYCLRADDSSSV